MNCFTSVAGTEGCTNSTSGEVVARATGAKSPTGSYGRWLISFALLESDENAKSSVYPSAWALATRSAPTIPEPAGRLSMTKLCFKRCVSCCARIRPTTSVPPPGANGTTMRTARAGYSSAPWASDAAHANAAIDRISVRLIGSPAARRSSIFSMRPPPIFSLLAAVFLPMTVALFAGAAIAQAYPAKPIRMIVPFPPGGGTDIAARTITNKLSEDVKWTFVVENKPGAGGNLGVEQAVKSAADGYTLVIGQTSNLAINSALHAKLPYDPLRDLIPVALIVSAPVVFVVAASSRYTSLGDLLAAAKTDPGGVTFASPGNGTVSHLAGELLQRAAGVKLTHVPYKGASQALTDTLGGQVQSFMSSVPSALSQIKAGRLRAIAVSSAKRARELPEVPTIAESGYGGFEANTWYGLLAPAGTPAPIIARLNAEVNRALRTPEVRERLASEGGEPLGGSPEQFASFLKAEHAKWGGTVRGSGPRGDGVGE